MIVLVMVTVAETVTMTVLVTNDRVSIRQEGDSDGTVSENYDITMTVSVSLCI